MSSANEYQSIKHKLERESRSTGPFDIVCIRCHGEKCDQRRTTFGVCVPCLQEQLRHLMRLEIQD
jgi:hypothetical protein